MKNVSLVLNAVLLVAVGILYYLRFSEAKPAGTVAESDKKEAVAVKSDSVPPIGGELKLPSSYLLYVNTDSLFDQYDYYQKLKKDFETKKKKMEADLTAQGMALEKEFMEAQQKAQSGLMTMDQMQSTERMLIQKQQNLMKRRDDLEKKLLEENEKLVDDLNSRISGFLKENAKKNNYKFVLGYSRGGGILFADDSLDVTDVVIEHLNKEYKKAGK